MFKKLEKYAPPGFNVKREVRLIITGYVLSILYSMSFFIKFFFEYRILFRNQYGRYIDYPSGVMPSCAHLLEGVFMLFWVLVAAMAVLVMVHYQYYYTKSKSIYLMKRLSDKRELFRRNWSIPLFTVAAILITVFVLIVIYYIFYMSVAPKNCIWPNQWLRIWRLYQ